MRACRCAQALQIFSWTPISAQIFRCKVFSPRDFGRRHLRLPPFRQEYASWPHIDTHAVSPRHEMSIQADMIIYFRRWPTRRDFAREYDFAVIGHAALIESLDARHFDTATRKADCQEAGHCEASHILCRSLRSRPNCVSFQCHAASRLSQGHALATGAF